MSENSKKSLLQIIPVVLLALALPIGLNLISQQTQFKSRASNDPIVFKVDGTNVVERNGQKVAIGPGPKPKVTVLLTSPIGPPGSATGSPAPSTSASPSPSPSASASTRSDKGEAFFSQLASHFAVGQVYAQATPSCTDFYIESLTPSGQINASGGRDYVVNASDFGSFTAINRSLKIAPFGMNFEVTTNPIVSPTNSGGYLVSIPKNTTTAAVNYTIAARSYVTSGGSTTYQACNPITITVNPSAPVASTTATTCSTFTLTGAGLTDNGTISGGRAYRMVSAGGEVQISAGSLTSSQFTPSSASLGASAVYRDPAGTQWFARIPANTTSSPVTYTISGATSSGGACNTITVEVAPTAVSTCSSFTLDGLAPSSTGIDGTVYTLPASGNSTGILLKANTVTSGFTPVVTTVSPPGAGAATVQSDGSGHFLTVPANTSTTVENMYQITTTFGTACRRIVVKVNPTTLDACSSFTLSGTGVESLGFDTDGVTPIYKVPSEGGGKKLQVNGSNSNFTATVDNTAATVNPNYQNSGETIIIFPSNPSYDDQVTYAVSGSVTGGGACRPFKVKVDKKTTNTCDYQDTVIKFQKPGSSSWDLNGEIAKGEVIKIAAFHKPKGNGAVFSSTPAADVRFSYVGPAGDGPLTPVSGVVTFNPVETITSPTTYTINVVTDNQGATGCSTSKQIVVKPATFVTTKYKIAESPDRLLTAPEVTYTGEPMTADVEFSDPTPGRKFVFVQFIGTGSDGTRKTDDKTAFIDYVGPDPKIEGVVCKPDISGKGITVQIKGVNLGAQSERSAVLVGGAAAEITGDWAGNLVSVKSDRAVPDTEKQSFPVVLTRADGVQTRSICKLGLSQLTVEPKLSCAAATGNLLNGKNGDVTIVDSAGAIAKEKITIDSDGTITGLKFRLLNGQRYRLYLKAGNALKRSKEFTASEGTTVLSDFELPFGDLNNDGKINTADYRMLLAAWSAGGSNAARTTTFTAPAQSSGTGTTLFTAPAATTRPIAPATSPSPSSSTRPGVVLAATSDASTNYDLNGDGVINSFDLKCMIASFNQSDDTENNRPPAPEVQPVASPSPTPSVSTSPTPTPTTSASPSTSPTPSSSTAL